MTTQQFFDKWNGKYVDYDGAYGFQCVDLMRQYCKDVFDVNGYVAIPSRGNAKDIFYNFKDNNYFRKIYNGPTNAPLKGDIVFFKTYPFIYGIAGHVAVVSEANSMNMISFDQNYPTNSSCHYYKHSYRGCIGWLTPKK